MKRLGIISLIAALAGCGDHDHGSVTAPDCVRIEEACETARNPAQMNCHDLAHTNNATMCTARVQECLATCGGDAGVPPG